MNSLDNNFIDQAVQSCFNLYNKLPKTGKPTDDEWTVLSCIVKHDLCAKTTEVVSLGTGSKCIGATKMSPRGDIMNDSHAEVFARRGFIYYLYDNMDQALNKKPSIFTYDKTQFKQKDHIEFIFYSSQLPCGDASIIPKCDDEQFGHKVESRKHKAEDIESDPKRLKLDEDIHRTGAKCLHNASQDLKGDGINYHTVGQVRTKPGRGDRTLSVSCSDKMAKWIHLGIQGSLLHMLCGPIHIKHYIFGSGVPYSESTLNRAFLNRNNVDANVRMKPQFYQTSLVYVNIRNDRRLRPAPGSVIWIQSNKQILEVAVQGKKLGVTKKSAALPSSSLCISKYNLYKKFLSVLSKDKHLQQHILPNEDLASVPYNKMKEKSHSYVKEWKMLKEMFFKVWTVKPDMWHFCVATASYKDNTAIT